MPPRGLAPSGLVLVDKPAGPTSFAIVRKLRAETGARTGHAGTLDPFATGLLLVLLGASTRLAQYLVGLEKRYETAIDLRATTASGDLQGELLEEHAAPSDEELATALGRLRGEVELRVPAVSAVKIDGERAYKLARRGVDVEMPVRRSTVHELELTEYREGIALLDLRVSSGTYVRAIADALGGHCIELRRTAVGPFRIEDADPQRMVAPVDALPFLPLRELSGEDATALRNGQTVAGSEAGPLRAVHAGELVAIVRGDGERLRPETVLP